MILAAKKMALAAKKMVLALKKILLAQKLITKRNVLPPKQIFHQQKKIKKQQFFVLITFAKDYHALSSLRIRERKQKRRKRLPFISKTKKFG